MPSKQQQPTTPVELTESEAALIYLLRTTQSPKDDPLENEVLRPYYDRFVRRAFTDMSQTLAFVYHAAKLDALKTTTTELEKALSK